MDGPATGAPLAPPTKRSQGSDTYSNTLSGYTYLTCGYGIDTHNTRNQQLKPEETSFLTHFSPPHRPNPYYSLGIPDTHTQLTDHLTSESATRFNNHGDVCLMRQNIVSNETFSPYEANNPYRQQFGELDPYQQHQGASASIHGLSLSQENLLCPFPEDFQDTWNDPSIQPHDTTSPLDGALSSHTYNLVGDAGPESGLCE